MSSPSEQHLSTSPIHYSVTVSNTSEHLLDVQMQVDISAASAPINHITLSLPAWIPGSYMVRDFARNLHSLACADSQISIRRQDKQTWVLARKDGETFTQFEVSYQIYAYDLSVRSAFIDDQYAFFNGTSVFLSIKDFEHLAHSVYLDANVYTESTACPTGLASSLLLKQKSSAHHPRRIFECSDYYDLIEHPVLLGHFDQHSFDVLGYQFHLVFSGHHPIDFTRLENDLRPIIQHHIDLFGELPCSEYWFITLVCDQGFGGLEHVASTVLQYSRFDLPLLNKHDTEVALLDVNESAPVNKPYQQFLSLCSHELFHTWHVKRIKPALMHQPDLSQEVYTEQLWIYEGFTSLYDDLSLARAKVISPKEYVKILDENITRLLKNPGRLKQSVSESSFEAWSKFYKQDAGSINHIVSYYNKGAIVALCLDIMLRQQSDNQVSLDHLMLALWQDYGKTNVGTQDDVVTHICMQHFNIDISSFVHMATQTTLDLPLPTMLESIGLSMQLRPSHTMQDKGGKAPESILRFDIGANFSQQEKCLRVNNVQADRAASLAGLQVNDLIVAVDNWQCDEARFYRILQQYDIGAKVNLHVMRDGRLLVLRFTLYPAINDTCQISIQDETRFHEWLGIAG